MFQAKKAKRQRRPLKISLEGLSGGGKTYTALRLAFDMRRRQIGKRIVVIDSENESAGLYAGVVEDGEAWEYETAEMPQSKRNPAGYTEAYEWAVGEGYDIVIIDSLSHAWHGALAAVDAFAKSHKGDKFGGWADITPQQQLMIQTLTDTRAHCISTMRVKSDFQDQEVNGRVRKVKVGMKADQRDNTEYEYDIVMRFEAGNEVFVEKVRGCSAMNGRSVTRPGPAFWKPLFDWWLSAEPESPKPDPVEAFGKLIDAAETLDQLRGVMAGVNVEAKAGRLTPAQINALGRRKDARKDALAAPAPAPQSQQQPAPDDDLEADDLRATLLHAIQDAGYSVTVVYEQFGRRAGIDPTKRSPSVDELTPDQCRQLLAALGVPAGIGGAA